jgi:hypothetical protein
MKQKQSLGTEDDFSPIEGLYVMASPNPVETAKAERKRRKKRSKNRKKRHKDHNSSSSSPSSLPAATNGLFYWMELNLINGEASKRHRDHQRCQHFRLPDNTSCATIDGMITGNSEMQEPKTTSTCHSRTTTTSRSNDNGAATCSGNNDAENSKDAFDSLNDFEVPMSSLGRSKSKDGCLATTMRAKILLNLRRFLRKSFPLPRKRRHEQRWSRLSLSGTMR